MNGDFLERMVALANYVGNELGALPDDDARYEMVVEIVESAEIVFAVWQDRSARDGVGYTMVKGQAIARQAVAVKRSVSTRIAAIPCQNAEQAEVLLQEFSERGTLH